MENDSAIWTEKYRPKKFSEVVGQNDIIKRIESLTKAMNIPHLLFAGPAGIGKSTLLLVINRMIERIIGAKVQGDILIDNADVKSIGDVEELRDTRPCRKQNGGKPRGQKLFEPG